MSRGGHLGRRGRSAVRDTAALMLGRIGVLALGRRARWVVIGAWVALAIALAPFQPKLQTRAADESNTFRTRGADSTLAHKLLETRFAEGGDSNAVIAYRYDQGSIYSQSPRVIGAMEKICAGPEPRDLKAVVAPDSVICGTAGHVLAPQTGPSAFSDDSPESMVLLTAISSRDDTESVVRDVAAIRKRLPGPDAKGLKSYVTGQAGFDADRSAAVEGIDGTLLAITGALVLVLMLLTYRSLTIAALMLAVVVIAYIVATGAVYGLVAAGVTTVSGQSAAILIVLMFGAGTDYCLLIVSRFREELARGGEVDEAMARAAARTGPSILASGGIVIAAMLVLGLADFNATREMGPILALGVAVMVACGLTLLPATLAALGTRAFWPAIPKPGDEEKRGNWTAIGRVVRRRPMLLASVSAGILVLGALGNLDGRGYLDLSHQYRDPPESVQGQELIRKRYPPGRVAPLDVVASPAVAGQVRDA